MSPPPSDLGGSTGAQRKARAGTMPPAGTPTSVADSPADAPGEGRVDDAADGPTDATTVQSPPPIVVPVPPEVRRAVAEAAGSAPDTALVHMGEHAHGQADALNAEAFTRDGEIFLAADAQLDTPRGQALLAHELTHVVQQQRESIPMPEESTDKGKEHEEAATRVERALAEPPRAADPVALHHAGPTRSAAETVVPLPPSLSQAPRSVGASPALSPQAVNVPQGVQRKAVGSDEEDRIRMPPQPVLEPAHASVLQPTLKEQVDLVHAGKTANGMGPAQDAPPTLSQLPRPASAARPEAGTALAIPSTVSVTPSGPPGSSSGPVGGSSGGGSRESSGSGSDSWEVSRPEPSALEKGIGYFSRMTSAPAAAPQDEDSERGELERQADSLYPFIRSRLRAELVRDLERRGRLSREWR